MEIVKPEDLKKNDVVTVLRWVNRHDRSYLGDVMNVVTVDLPFIVLSRSEGIRMKVSLDTREIELAIPSDEYIKSLRPAVCGSKTT